MKKSRGESSWMRGFLLLLGIEGDDDDGDGCGLGGGSDAPLHPPPGPPPQFCGEYADCCCCWACFGWEQGRACSIMASPSALLSVACVSWSCPVTKQFCFLGIFHHPDLPKEKKEQMNGSHKKRRKEKKRKEKKREKERKTDQEPDEPAP